MQRQKIAKKRGISG